MRSDLFAQYIKIFNYIGRDELSFYRYLIIKMEMDEILSCIRFLNAGRQDEFVFTIPSYFAKHAGFDLYGLAKVKSYDELLRLLKDSRFYPALKKYEFKEDEKIDIVKIEIDFNKLFYNLMLKTIKKTFSGEVMDEISKSFGMQIDLQNIIDILRLKKYFNAKSDYIKALLLPYNFKIKPQELAKIMDSPDSDAALKAVRETYYGRFFAKYDFDLVDKYSSQIMWSYHKNLIAFSTSAPVAVVSYLNLKDIEIENIVNIIEGIRYGIAPATISKLLIGANG